MELTGVHNENQQALSHQQVALSAEVKQSSGLVLRTQEGDVVNLSFNSREAYSESAQKTGYSDGTTVQAFSATALAASKYSMTVQGDLNEEELAAIDKLAQAVAPIAQSFFSGSAIDTGKVTESLQGSLGTVQEMELKLEQTVSGTLSASGFSRAGQGEKTSAAPDTSAETPDNQGIRDIKALVNSVVESVFKNSAGQVADDNPIMNSLQDLVSFLEKKLIELLAPLERRASGNQPSKSETEPPPQPQPAAANQPPDAAQHAA